MHFNDDAIKFLRGLEKHNDREWFEERRKIYEDELKAPLLAIVAEVNFRLREFSPSYVRLPQKAMMRIYRDIRFSEDKTPYKTHVSAWWPHQKLMKMEGAGFYLQVSGKEVMIAGGCYAPDREVLLTIRQYLVDHYKEMRALLKNKAFTSLLEPFDGNKLSRPPRGFAADLPGLDLILCRQWGATAKLPSAEALKPGFVDEIVRRFRALAPLVEFLNRPVVTSSDAKSEWG